MRLGDFRFLTFDCYGTLIDWETGIHAALQPLLRNAGEAIGREAALQAFARLEAEQEALTPTMIYSDLLAEVHRKLAKEWGMSPKAGHARLPLSTVMFAVRTTWRQRSSSALTRRA